MPASLRGKPCSTRPSLSAACTLTLLAAMILTGCGGGAAGGGDSQSPDPVVVDLPIAYISRTLPVDENGDRVANDILEPTAFNAGAALFLKPRATAAAVAVNISDAAFEEDEMGLYDVKNLEVSADGNLLLFTMRAPEIENADEDEQPRWNIWEYARDTDTLRRVMSSDNNAEGGHDVDPHYLPDGRIVFSSDRQRRSRSILLDDNKPQYSGLAENLQAEAFVLHVMNPDGTGIQQITYNQSHDLQPSVLSDGRILFNRWNRTANINTLSLYTVLPDGSQLSPYYGHHSQDTGTDDSEAIFAEPRPMPDGRILSIHRPRESEELGGDLLVIDGENFTEVNQTFASNLGGSGEGQASLSVLEVTSDGSPSPHGRFSSAWPLNDGTNRLLVGWNQCRLLDPTSGANVACTTELLNDPDIEQAAPLYGLWIYNLDDQSQQVVVTPEEGLMIAEVASLENNVENTFVPSALDIDLAEEGVGVLHIRSVYDFDGVDLSPLGINALADPLQATAAQRPARFLRIVKAVSIPDDEVLDFDGSAFGRSRAQLMREILGYVPIEPDGSVKVKVPADVAFMISIVDAQGQRITERHQNWLQLRPGETRECTGCHTSDSELPHGRLAAEAASINNGAVSTGLPFPNTEPALFADAGETMAETFARIRGIREPQVDIEFVDEWTDPAARAKDPSLSLSYSDLLTEAPATSACQSNWSSNCRTLIHYEDHIQGLWDLPREILDGNGTLLEDQTCTSCHSNRDANDALMVPAGQLSLIAMASPENPMHLVSYRELMFNDSAQEVVEGALIDQLVPVFDGNGNQVFEVDENGDQVLDINGDPIPVLVTVNVSASMNTFAARFSRFFTPFATGGSHEGYLSPAELKLISEWLDIGGQYYNNPFDVPLN